MKPEQIKEILWQLQELTALLLIELKETPEVITKNEDWRDGNGY